MQNNKLIVFIIIISLFGCKRNMEKKQLNVELTIVKNNELTGKVVITNNSNNTVLINYFNWENATLILEVLDGDKIVNTFPPPIPPKNNENNFKKIGKNEELIIPLKGLEILESHMNNKKLKVRCVGFYKNNSENKYRKVVSNWENLSF